jgi:hypothetical protein
VVINECGAAQSWTLGEGINIPGSNTFKTGGVCMSQWSGDMIQTPYIWECLIDPANHTQDWSYNTSTKQIENLNHNVCLEMKNNTTNSRINVGVCDATKDAQKWTRF